MIWTMLKIVLFLAAVAGLALGAEALMDQQAGLRIAFADTEFTLGPVQMALAALILLGGLWLLLKLAGLTVATLRFINGDETAISRYFERSRRKRGLDALSEGFFALAAGEGEQALTRARKAEKLLDNQPLTDLLMAQAAQTKGNTQLAEDYYKRLLENDRARFVGVRGLMRQQIDAGNTTKARKLAQTALSLRPGHGETQDTLLMLQNKAGDWSGARHTLLEASRSGRLPRAVYRRRDAVLTLQQARAEAGEGREELSYDLAVEANKASPELIPAAVMAAEALIARGKGRQAAAVLRRAWKTQPHPDLARAFAAIAPNEAPTARVKRFEALLKENDGAESAQTRAELLIAAEDFPAARRAIGDLHETRPTQRVMTIMAAIERGEGSPDAVVRGWLARALTAPRGAQWVCEKCNEVHSSWAAICDNCGSFDTLSWNAPNERTAAGTTGSEMLPLIVGALPAAEDHVDTDDEIDEDSDIVEVAPAPDAEAEPVSKAAAPEPPSEAEVIDLSETRRSGL